MSNILHITRLDSKEIEHCIKMIDYNNPFNILGYNVSYTEEGADPIIKFMSVSEYNEFVEKQSINQSPEILDGAPKLDNFKTFYPIINIIDIVNQENVLDETLVNNLNITMANKVPIDLANSDFDCIVIGISDAGVDIFTPVPVRDPITMEIVDYYQPLQILLEARAAGKSIIFTHDCLEVNSFAEPFPENYSDIIKEFGVDSYSVQYDSEKGNGIDSITCVDAEHPILNSYFELPLTLEKNEIQFTHNSGFELNKNAKIVYKDTNRDESQSNYYLATYEEENKGKIVFLAMGHNNGSLNEFFRPSINECKILANSIVWCLQ